MKLKRIPEDFRVDEQTNRVAGGGAFALYRLTKRSFGTPEAVIAVLKKWNIPRDRVAYGGLKDRHALTSQYLTIKNGPARGMKQTSIELEYLGQTDRPFASSDIASNRFAITLRDLDDGAVERATRSAVSVAHDGLPNYFDEQRFGSRGASGEFIAKAWCLGDYERAIWLAIADAHEHDRPRQREEREHLREHWGDWQTCRSGVEFPPAKQIVEYFCIHRKDFRGALRLLRPDMRWLYISAYQSHLWNRILTAALVERCAEDRVFHMMIDRDPAAFFWSLSDAERTELAGLQLPLPAARNRLEEGPMKQLVERVLANSKITMRDLDINYPRGSFFSKGERSALFLPASFACDSADDDLYPGRKKLQLHFELPRGCYATVLLRRLEV